MNELPSWEQATFDEDLPSWEQATFDEVPTPQASPEPEADWRQKGRALLLGGLESLPFSKQMVGGANALLGGEYEEGKQYHEQEQQELMDNPELSPYRTGGEIAGTIGQTVPLAAGISKQLLNKGSSVIADGAQNQFAKGADSVENIQRILQESDMLRKKLGMASGAVGIGVASGGQAGLKEYGESGDISSALQEGAIAGAIGAATPVAGSLASKFFGKIGEFGSKTGERAAGALLGDKNPGFLKTLGTAAAFDAAMLNPTMTTTKLVGGSKIVEKVGKGLEKAITPKTTYSPFTGESALSNTGGTTGFSTLTNYLMQDKKQAEDEFSNNQSNTYNKGN